MKNTKRIKKSVWKFDREYIIAKRAIDYEIACGRLVKTTTYDDELRYFRVDETMIYP